MWSKRETEESKVSLRVPAREAQSGALPFAETGKTPAPFGFGEKPRVHVLDTWEWRWLLSSQLNPRDWIHGGDGSGEEHWRLASLGVKAGCGHHGLDCWGGGRGDRAARPPEPSGAGGEAESTRQVRSEVEGRWREGPRVKCSCGWERERPRATTLHDGAQTALWAVNIQFSLDLSPPSLTFFWLWWQKTSPHKCLSQSPGSWKPYFEKYCSESLLL